MYPCRRLLLGVLALALAVDSARAETPRLAVVLARAGAYVLQFEERFAFVISDERYAQHAMGRAYLAPVDRSMVSEMLFLWLADARSWLAVRNVLSVDGQAIGDSARRLDRLLASTAPIGITRLRQLASESARYNLGHIGRTFNDPLLAVRFLEPDSQRRFKLTLQGEEMVDGVRVSKIAFDEKASPTVIQDNGRDRPARGMIWIAEDGAIVRTRLEVGDRLRGYTTSIVVDYQRDPKLEMLVPMTMHEKYMQIMNTYTIGPLGPVGERIDCEATYSNFRRFETAARIVPEH